MADGARPRSGAEVSPVGPAVTVDPRMRSRRIDVRRAAGRRRLQRLTIALGVLALVVSVAAVTRSPLLDVDHVTVEGAAGERAGAVRAAAGLAADQPLVSLDGAAVAGRVEELPWVASARVGRSWPSTVRIEVTERRVVALVPVTGDHVALVDAGGHVVSIEPVSGAAEGTAGGSLPVIRGVEGVVAEGRRLGREARDALAVAAAMADRMPGRVASLSTDLDAELVAGGVVRFGSAQDLAEKVTAVETVLVDVDVSCMALLDVRVPDSPALTRSPGC